MVLDPVQSLTCRARQAVLAALAASDIDGHLCALALRRDRPSWAADAIESLLSAPARGLARASDVAVIGLRHALGMLPTDREGLVAALRRELSRQPLPPLKRAHEDERLMLGIAAGVATVPELLPLMTAEFSVAKGRSARWDVVLLWAELLARGAWDSTSVGAAANLVVTSADQVVTFVDAAAILALVADLFDETGWRPDDAALSAIERATERARRVLVLDEPADLEPFDAALLLRGLAAAPSHRHARRSSLEAVLATIDSFPAALQLLANRPLNRAGLPRELDDERDVQWLLHALLLPAVPDLVPEDPAPKLAGAGSRLDFTSRAARLGIEVKHIRERKAVGRMREELMVDERQYQEHPYVETVAGFVHDPRGHISLAERPAFERDLSVPVTVAGRTVNYVVRVR
jgi:hypothetical protein